MTVDTKEIVTIVAYMIGVKESALETSYREECSEKLDFLYNNKEASIIRYLSKLRTSLLQHFKKTDDAMRYDLKNLTSLEWFDKSEIEQLSEWGIDVVKANYRSERYIFDLTKLINENIDKCSSLFYDWVNWDYIKKLFLIPKYSKPNVLRNEFTKYMSNIEYYPFQMYIYWEPEDCGGILLSDRKFLKFLYNMNGDVFTDHTKYRDADDDTRNNIYNFINNSEKIAVAVDCENSNPFKLYSVIKGLNPEEIEKIEKITLYDDPNTTSGWDWLTKFISIPIEHIEIERVTDKKSLVDIQMTASVVKGFYTEGITSFIIVSSDSDFWGLIKSLPEADFLVMYENNKCGTAIKEALSSHGIYYCSIDDFCSAGTEDMKRSVLFAELENYFPYLIGENPLELTKRLYENTKITATEKEMDHFCTRYVKTLKLKVIDGKFEIEIQK